MPKQSDVEIPLLQVLTEIGGQGKPRDIYPLVTPKFTQIRDEERAETLKSGTNRWMKRIQWVRQRLVEASGAVDQPVIPSFIELYEDYEAAFRSQLLEKLQKLSQRESEYFARRLLVAYGFVEVRVTQVGSVGGIDGNGRLRLGLATMNVAFQ